MAHYAFLDSSNTVTEVIVGCDEGVEGRDGPGWEQFYAAVISETSHLLFLINHAFFISK